MIPLLSPLDLPLEWLKANFFRIEWALLALLPPETNLIFKPRDSFTYPYVGTHFRQTSRHCTVVRVSFCVARVYRVHLPIWNHLRSTVSKWTDTTSNWLGCYLHMTAPKIFIHSWLGTEKPWMPMVYRFVRLIDRWSELLDRSAIKKRKKQQLEQLGICIKNYVSTSEEHTKPCITQLWLKEKYWCFLSVVGSSSLELLRVYKISQQNLIH